jgi:hypothetical protein
MRQALPWMIALCSAALAGCAAHTLTMPPNFVPFDKPGAQGYYARAVSADGVVVALRSQPNPKGATLDFWSEAARNELVEGRGYRFEAAHPVKSEGGATGSILAFTTETQGVKFTYWLALFVQGDLILIAEAGGKTEALVAKADQIQKAFLTVK